MSLQMDRRLSEYDLHRIFSAYGSVEEITIKDCHMDQVSVDLHPTE